MTFRAIGEAPELRDFSGVLLSDPFLPILCDDVDPAVFSRCRCLHSAGGRTLTFSIVKVGRCGWHGMFRTVTVVSFFLHV